jgi:hypothetical protein
MPELAAERRQNLDLSRFAGRVELQIQGRLRGKSRRRK